MRKLYNRHAILISSLCAWMMFSTISCSNKECLQTDLIAAVCLDNTKNLQRDLSLGANPSYIPPDSSYSPLLLASGRGYRDIVRLLLENKAEVNFRDKNGYNALFYSVTGAKDCLVDSILIANGIDLSANNASGKTVFQVAVDTVDTSFVDIFNKHKLPLADNRNDSLLSIIASYARKTGKTNLVYRIYLSLDSARKIDLEKKDSIVFTGRPGSRATDNFSQFPNGVDTFVRLSPYPNDHRFCADSLKFRINTYATTKADYLACVNNYDNPTDRYAIPDTHRILWAYYFCPKSTDTIQWGIVKPEYNHIGGGIEAYFKNGTFQNTYLFKTQYGQK